MSVAGEVLEARLAGAGGAGLGGVVVEEGDVGGCGGRGEGGGEVGAGVSEVAVELGYGEGLVRGLGGVAVVGVVRVVGVGVGGLVVLVEGVGVGGRSWGGWVYGSGTGAELGSGAAGD